LAVALAVPVAPVRAAPPPGPGQGPGFLMVKLGDEAATPEMAADFLSRLGSWLGAHVSRFRGGDVEGWIANREPEARRILEERKPALAMVPAGVYLGHLREGERAARPVAQIPRFGARAERYYVVGPRNGPASLEDLGGRALRTVFSYPEPYLRRVVFPPGFRPGEAFRLEPAENLADEIFLLMEGGGDAPAAVLLDEELKRFFEEDDLVWPELRVIWTSDPLPRDLVVTLGEWSDDERARLREDLFSMGETAGGREILDLMDSSGFEPVNEELLGEAVKRYAAGP
nr:phosphate/phosphite/phosphonate ABC transporter substrate-binding protein [Gemmatimonadota bacterium]NIR80556.1 phosphate/phosphite/phosphonate ABC transporter substrate-binding protein [Gemmatimonadota bacterium]NIT89321.1 phosphate/phosphite/phosphonate ABC transporter substrate-binding protein [Gemmatimonadota bacterium]NIU33127.1 phosphate/phosphite/phosphonate ABC transporter substrate-binding protein [Gemmatimonadota bacterium]NIU37492.1 PhnD/SsuA/transferrin family substrate-binding p